MLYLYKTQVEPKRIIAVISGLELHSLHLLVMVELEIVYVALWMMNYLLH